MLLVGFNERGRSRTLHTYSAVLPRRQPENHDRGCRLLLQSQKSSLPFKAQGVSCVPSMPSSGMKQSHAVLVVYMQCMDDWACPDLVHRVEID